MEGGILNISGAAWEELVAHLLPTWTSDEQGAFLLVKQDQGGPLIHLETIALQRSDFVTQGSDFLELTDEARIGVIKAARTLDCSLCEFHSHPLANTACMSCADMAGLRTFGPHMVWRMKGRPYGACVVAGATVDGIIWGENGTIQPLACVNVNGNVLPTTGLTWKNITGGKYGTL
ncbi:MAG: hypothetical protein JWR22_1356 [Herminiimonas sp.]|nr:hypothetical protein [Herminiimonas sp.]